MQKGLSKSEQVASEDNRLKRSLRGIGWGSLSRVILVFLLLFQMAIPVLGAEGQQSINNVTLNDATKSDLRNKIDLSIQYLLSQEELSDWAAFAVGVSGIQNETTERAIEQYLNETKKRLDNNEFRLVTDWERLALALIANGVNVESFHGVNVMERIFNHERLLNQGVNGPAFALLALESSTYEPLNTKWNEESLISEILVQQDIYGGWSIIAGKESTVDITASALTALAPYSEQWPAVKSSIQKGLNWLKQQQKDNGGFAELSIENVQSAASVMIALSALGLDSQDFKKSQSDVYSYLLEYFKSDGSFSHLLGQESNGMATENAILALLAYERFIQQQGSLFTNEERERTVPVTAEIYGPKGLVVQSEAKAHYALEAVEQILQSFKIPYEVQSMSFGKYMYSIQETVQAQFGGWDGWNYSIYRDGEWMTPSVGISDFVLQKGDRIVVHYTDYDYGYVDKVELSPALPEPNEPMQIRVTKAVMNWNTGQLEVSPAAGVEVGIISTTSINGVQIPALELVTDENGEVVLSEGLDGGLYNVMVSDDADNRAAKIVPQTIGLYITQDAKQVSSWAAPFTQKALQLGLLSGVGKSLPQVAGKKEITRAEFVTMVLRAMNRYAVTNDSEVESAYADVNAASWYAKYVARAKQIGLIDRKATNFKPNRAITREEAAIIIARAVGLDIKNQPKTTQLKDELQISQQALPYVQAIMESGLMQGSAGKFAPKQTLTREMAAVMMVKWVEGDWN